MKRIFVLTICATLIFASSSFAGDAIGSVFGSLSTAGTLGMGRGNFGLAVGLADATSFTGSFNYGLSSHTDGRIKLALFDAGGEADTELALGADFKYQLVSVSGVSNGPFDMALGGFFEYLGGGGDAILVGGQFIGSYPVTLERGGTLTPYGRFNIRMESFSSETELQVGLNGGVEWKLNPGVSLFGEFQIDGNDGVFFGIEFGAL